MVQRERIIDTFVSLVRIDSESGYERDIVDDVCGRFRCLGLDVIEDESAERTGHEAGNVIATWHATPGYEHVPTLLFAVHLDTVTPGRGIQPIVGDDDIIRSDGTTILGSDDKAGVAAWIEAVTSMIEDGERHGRVQLVCTVGEERGLIGAQALDRAMLHGTYGFALDSEGRVGSVCIGGPSQAKIVATIRGVAAHAGCHPEDGVSAITIAARAIARLPWGRIDAQTTANVGRIEGGGPTNVVVDHVIVHAEARSHDAHKLESVLDAMRTVFAQEAALEGGTASVDAQIPYAAYVLADDEDVVVLAKEAFASMGIQSALFVSGGGSDAHVFNHMGIPTVNLGIGYEAIHTTQEHIRIDDLIASAHAVQAIVRTAVHRSTQ
ncbi:MAG: M20/M25/M40 family metallo-hydrolase [Paenibacillaceae bacterium]|nr:M20/M25/M40 family metallo-hydrolase [Paenibacillaceae bacterium]